MNDSQLLTRLAGANAYGENIPLPEPIWTRELALREIERRMDMDTHDSTEMQTPSGVTEERSSPASPQTERPLKKPTAERRWSRSLVGAAAFALIVVIGTVIVVVSLRGDGSQTISPDPNQPFTAQTALAVSDTYFAGWEAYDADAILDLFIPEAIFANNLGGRFTVAEFEARLAYFFAQGTVLTSSGCTETDPAADDTITVECDYSWHEGLAQAVGAPPVPVLTSLVVTPAGISSLRDVFGQPSFVSYNTPFRAWMGSHQPPKVLALLGCCGFPSVEVADESGRLTAQYGQEWAAYLVESGCSYEDVGC